MKEVCRIRKAFEERPLLKVVSSDREGRFGLRGVEERVATLVVEPSASVRN
jgi:hypothetical protein